MRRFLQIGSFATLASLGAAGCSGGGGGGSTPAAAIVAGTPGSSSTATPGAAGTAAVAIDASTICTHFASNPASHRMHYSTGLNLATAVEFCTNGTC